MVVINQVTLNSSSIPRESKGSLVRGKEPTIISVISPHPLPKLATSFSKFFQNFGRDAAMGRGELISVFNEGIKDKILRYLLT